MACGTAVYKKLDGSCACAFSLGAGLGWSQAIDRCKALGARLPEIHTAAENNDINNFRVNFLFW